MCEQVCLEMDERMLNDLLLTREFHDIAPYRINWRQQQKNLLAFILLFCMYTCVYKTLI